MADVPNNLLKIGVFTLFTKNKAFVRKADVLWSSGHYSLFKKENVINDKCGQKH